MKLAEPRHLLLKCLLQARKVSGTMLGFRTFHALFHLWSWNCLAMGTPMFRQFLWDLSCFIVSAQCIVDHCLFVCFLIIGSIPLLVDC